MAETTDQWNEFTDKYTLVLNHLNDNAPGDGYMFETFGPEVEFVKAQEPNRIWTLVDGDSGDEEYILQGWHFVNRVGYFITTEPAEAAGESYRY